VFHVNNTGLLDVTWSVATAGNVAIVRTPVKQTPIRILLIFGTVTTLSQSHCKRKSPNVYLLTLITIVSGGPSVMGVTGLDYYATDRPTVVVLTSPAPAEWGSLSADAGTTVVTLSAIENDDTWVARTSIELAQRCPAHVWQLLVFGGETARFAPQLGFAQRSARRKVGGYVLVDPQLPAPGTVSDWPDAPVTVVITRDAVAAEPLASAARLRGWTIVHGDAASAVADLSAQP